jgi:hypothetical protein
MVPQEELAALFCDQDEVKLCSSELTMNGTVK